MTWSLPLESDVQLVVFTDLDGTLLDHETYSFQPAKEALEVLRDQQIPVILCSSKTRAEIELIQLDLRLTHPFISENGGAIFLPRGYFPITPADALRRGDYEILESGLPYWQLVETLHRIAKQVGVKVVGFSDLTNEEVAQDCKLSVLEARLAKLREYDEPFRILRPTPGNQSRLFRGLHRAGLRCIRGGRYFHVTGVADKGQAVRRLCALFKQVWQKVATIGLGDSLNDLPLLQEADVPVVVRNPASGAATRLLRKVPTAHLTRAEGPRGWNEAILEMVGRRTSEAN